MTPQDSVFIIVTMIFTTITIVFIIRYCKLLALARSEYEKAKGVISGIILTFNTRLNRQDETIDRLTLQTETAHFAIERATNRFQVVENKVKDLGAVVESTPLAQKEVINRIDTLRKEVDKVSENQQNLEKQLVVLEEKIQGIGKEENLATVDESPSFSKLTETERIVLQFLTNEGAKSAPEVEDKIGKTREHTARLMKKLWQEGYIERDTHRIPYVYRVTENLNKMEIKDLNPT